MGTRGLDNYSSGQNNWQTQRNRVAYWEDFIGGLVQDPSTGSIITVTSGFLKGRYDGTGTLEEATENEQALGVVACRVASTGVGPGCAAVETQGVHGDLISSSKISGRVLLRSLEANQRALFGVFFDVRLSQLPDYVAIEYNLDQSPNWLVNNRFGGIDDYVDSGILVSPNTWYRLEVSFSNTPTTESSSFSVNNVVIGGNSSVLPIPAPPPSPPQTAFVGARMYGLGPNFADNALAIDYIGLNIALKR